MTDENSIFWGGWRSTLGQIPALSGIRGISLVAGNVFTFSNEILPSLLLLLQMIPAPVLDFWKEFEEVGIESLSGSRLLGTGTGTFNLPVFYEYVKDIFSPPPHPSKKKKMLDKIYWIVLFFDKFVKHKQHWWYSRV